MGDVVAFTGETTLDIDPDRVLEAAIGKLDRVIIMGATKDGEEYLAQSCSDITVAVWDLERAKLVLLRSFENHDEE